MEITITQAHIDRTMAKRATGEVETWRGMCTECPAALALQEASGHGDAWTTASRWGLEPLMISDMSREFWLPIEARKWIFQFDSYHGWKFDDFGNGPEYPQPTVPVTFNFEENPVGDGDSPW